MNINKAIERTKNRQCMRVSITGICTRISSRKGSLASSDKYMIREFADHFNQARKAWLDGNIEVIADFFSIYV